MSINFVDESEYANDMDELDDLTATVHPEQEKDVGEYLDELCGNKEPIRGPDAFDLCLSDDETLDSFKDPVAKTSFSGDSGFSDAAEKDALKFFAAETSFSDDDVPVIRHDQPVIVGGRTTAKATKPLVTTSVNDAESSKTAEEEQDQKRVLLVQIARYRETWPFLEDVITFPPNMHKKSVEKLEEIRNECSGRVQNRNCMKGLRIVFNGAMAQFETFVTTRFSSVELQGFAKACEMDEVVQDSIKELEIKYLSSAGVMAPEARLLMALMLVAYSTHNKNRTTRLIQGVAHSRAPDLGQRYSDL